MKKIFSLILIIYFTGAVAQTFEKIIKSPNDEKVDDAAFIDDDYVLFVHNYGETDVNYQSQVYKMNIYTGKIVDSVYVDFGFYEEYNIYAINRIIPFHDTVFVLMGTAQNKLTGDLQLYICHINQDLEKTYDTLTGSVTKSDWYLDYIINSNDNIMAVGAEIIESNNRISKSFSSQTSILFDASINSTSYTKLLSELSIWGNEIHRSSLSGCPGLGVSIADIPNQGKYHIHHLNNDHMFCVIDSSSYNLINTVDYPSWFRPGMVIQKPNNDTTYYVAGRHTQIDKSKSIKQLSFLEINQYGTIKNQFIYPTDSNIFYSYKTFDVNDNSIFFGTNIPFTYSPPLLYPERRWILLYKLDLSGAVLWQNFYKGEVNYMPLKIMATPDDGALIFSTRYDWNDPTPNQRDVHILKIDSDGNYIPLGMNETLVKQNQILVYPNPVKNKVNFIFGLYSDLRIDIFNLRGQKIFSKLYDHSPVIDLSEFPSGMYIYTITGNNGFFERGKLVKE